MNIDRTRGEEARYVVNIYWSDCITFDRYYYHGYREAKKFYDQVVASAEQGVTVTLYDLKKDVRKAYHRVPMYD